MSSSSQQNLFGMTGAPSCSNHLMMDMKSVSDTFAGLNNIARLSTQDYIETSISSKVMKIRSAFFQFSCVHNLKDLQQTSVYEILPQFPLPLTSREENYHLQAHDDALVKQPTELYFVKIQSISLVNLHTSSTTDHIRPL